MSRNRIIRTVMDNGLSLKLGKQRSLLAIGTLMVLSLNPAGQLASEEAYAIPEGLTPVSTWKSGFTAQDAERFRTGYRAIDFWSGTDSTVFTYLNLSEVLNTMHVARSGDVVGLENAPLPTVANTVATTQLGSMPLWEAISDPRSRVQAMVVVHKGRIVFEDYPGMQPFHRHSWNSASKPITGLLINQLVYEGVVDLSEPVSRYLPFTSGIPLGAISVADVLHQRTGLDYEETNTSISDPNHAIGFGFSRALAGRNEPVQVSIRDALSKVGQVRAPGTAFQYSSYNTQILGLIVEAVTQRPLNEVISARIWRAAGMEGDALLGLSSAGEALAAGAFSSRLRDFARFGMLFTPSGRKASGAPVVPESYLADVYAAADPDIYLEGVQGNRMVAGFGREGAPSGAAYQWDAVFEDGDLFKAGINGQGLYVSPGTDTVIAYFSTTFANSLYLIAYPRAIVNDLFR
ncbi:serine hydrolase [Ruegeria sp. PrR005]|uniref:Beta-lactamase family protein n=1 Tax=Ruegeria sp. PrR005 TaxID=2706882 RepID=A0A6B2NVL9_9RHOB|nr:serine hydrolase domain-containing protein [Ruegeria sp. PrR005]NDW46687.1 beta-lactamase family protein [Ruegeria sp. PrR005]